MGPTLGTDLMILVPLLLRKPRVSSSGRMSLSVQMSRLESGTRTARGYRLAVDPGNEEDPAEPRLRQPETHRGHAQPGVAAEHALAHGIEVEGDVGEPC